jgi:hypothetical protein
VREENGALVARGREGTLRVSAHFPGTPMTRSVRPTDGPDGRGARLGIPVHVVYEAAGVEIAPDRPFRSEIVLEIPPQEGS